MQLTLITERLCLRPLVLDDLDLATEMFTDPEVVRYVCDLLTPEQIAENIHNEIKRCGGGCIGIWCVVERRTSEKIGTGVLLPLPIDEEDTNWDLVHGPNIPDCAIEVGFILKRSAWGKGYATEICKRLLTFAFEETSLMDIVACTDIDNIRSQQVLRKCGLKEEGIQRAYAQEAPFFRITRADWLSDNKCSYPIVAD